MNNWIYTINISIGVAGLVLSLMGLFMSTFSRIIETQARHHLSWMFVILALYSATIILSYYAEIEAKAGLMRWGILLSSLFSSMMMLVLSSLMVHFTGEERRGNSLLICVSLLWVIYLGMLVSTFFSPAFYSISEKAVYLRGPWYTLLLFPPVLIMLVNLWGLWRRRKKLSRRQIFAFQVYILIPLLSMLIQMLYYGILATALGAMLGSMAMYLFVLSDQQDKFIRVTEENANRDFNIRILQIRPHFIYNVMSSIYYIVGEDPAKAQGVIRDFSIYLKKVFRSVTSQEPVPFTDELEHTRAYLSVETARFTDQLNVIYDTPYVDFKLPPLILQPVVENAVKHGMDPEIDRLNITIRTRHSEGFNEIIVDNDGEDFRPSLEMDEGVGLPNVRDRLKRMCGGELTVADREGGGTVVTIRIPDPGQSDHEGTGISENGRTKPFAGAKPTNTGASTNDTENQGSLIV